MKPKAPKKSAATTKRKAVRKKSPKNRVFSLLKAVCAALEEKKGDNIAVLDVSQQSTITDYLVLVTATSEPHLRALRVELEKALDAQAIKLVGIEQAQGSGWTVIDAFDVMVHVFTPENRSKYQLEQLWNDAKVVPLAKVL